ncbi:MAG TPA: hypothetical protein VHM19_20025 [Polyangiales bacterium]|nr:hypothetical protein [Polyangiales bacterium]
MLSACSDDSPKHSGTNDSGAGGQGGEQDSGMHTMHEHDAGLVPSGAEGAVCDAADGCEKGLRCIQTTNGSLSIGICARSCSTSQQCKKDEICYAYTKNPADAHCVNLVSKTYATCGVGDTSRCDQHTCLYFPSSTVGLCVDLCALPMNHEDGGVDDGGVVDSGLPVATCTGSEKCIEGVVDSTTQGLCGVEVARGAKCGVPAGLFCAMGDGCTPDDPKDESGPSHCRQDCTNDGKCAKGTECRGIVGQAAYCY